MAASVSHTYRFGDFRLDPAGRELWQGEELADLARRTFDGLVFLIKHRDRAVSRDELIETLWGRPGVEDIQVTQLVMRLRRLLADDSHEPRFIRAIPGFGYRWIAETEIQTVQASNDTTAHTADAPVSSGSASSPPSAVSAAPWYRRWQLVVPVVCAVALVAVVAAYFAYNITREVPPLAHTTGDAIVVMPLEVDDTGDADIGWARLGAMDLIAERMRDAGLPVPPSENVITALQGLSDLPESDRLPALRRALGADVLVQGTVRRADGGWMIGLSATTSDGQTRRIESEPAEIIPATGRAANLLLAALGRTAPRTEEGDDALSERLQRARAASLALELDTARVILANAPEALRNEPELRHELAWVEIRAGRPDVAETITTELLDDPAVSAQPRLHAQILIAHGVALVHKTGGWPAGDLHFDAAVAVLEDEPWAPELGIALAMRGTTRSVLHDFDSAVRDLGRARTLFEAGGRRLDLARFHNKFGRLELMRGRPLDALPHFMKSIEISQAFGHIDWLRANLVSLQQTQSQLLLWSDALDTSNHLMALLEHTQGSYQYHGIQAAYAEVLIALGRYSEAEAILDRLGLDLTGRLTYVTAYIEEVRAKLAWKQEHPHQVLQIMEQILELDLNQTDKFHLSTESLLLYQRASIDMGRAIPAVDISLSTRAEIDPIYIIAQAEWAAYQGDLDKAEHLFHSALAQAEQQAVPKQLVLVVSSYARWLINQDRSSEAMTHAGRVAGWAEYDYNSAMLQVSVLHANGMQKAWAVALRHAQRLAGEREIPTELLFVPK